MKMPLLKSEFSRNAITLMTGTTIAQAIPIAISPILTRIYTPEDFGLLALYSSILMIFSSLVTGKYHLSILVPSKNKDAQHLVVGSVVLSFATCLFLFILVCFFVNPIVGFLGNENIKIWLYFLPLNIFIVSAGNVLYFWANRIRNYSVMSKSQMLQSSFGGVIKLLLGFSKLNSGLIVGNFISGMFYLLYFFKKLAYSSNFSVIKKKRILILLKRYKKFPKFMILSELLESIAYQLPIFFISGYFGAAILGFYSLSQKISGIPSALIGVAIGNVFRQGASQQYTQKGNCKNLFITTLKHLTLLSLFPFVIFYFSAPSLFATIFGEEWRLAGVFAQLLTPMLFLQFVVGPLSNMFLVAEKQQYDMYIQICLLIFSGFAFGLGYFLNDVEVFLVSYCVVYCFKYLCELFLSYRFACGQ